MDQKCFSEIKARGQAATPGPWINDVRVGCVAVYSGEKANCIEETEDRRLFFAKGKMVLDKDINFDHWETEPQDIKNAAFIAHARTDIPILIEQHEQDQQQIATLKKALGLAEDMLTKMTPYKSKGGWHDRLIHQAEQCPYEVAHGDGMAKKE